MSDSLEFCPRSITFTIPTKHGVNVQVTAVEHDGNLDFTIDVLGTPVRTADLRGLFFHFDEADLPGLKIVGGDGFITGSKIAANGVIDLGRGVNMHGAAQPFDIGIAFGTPGQGRDVVNGPIHFTLDGVNALTLDDMAHVLFGVRLTSSGDKVTFLAPAAPDAHDDTFQIFEDGAADLNSPSKTPAGVTLNVAGNDTDADGDQLLITGFHEGPLHGTVSISADGHSVIYVPDLDYSGQDSFEYCVSDGHGGQDHAFVTVNVAAVADKPTISVDVQAGANVYEVILNVTVSQNDADSSEFLDRIEASVAGGLPPGVTIEPLGAFNPAGEPDQIVQQFVARLPPDTDINFDLTLTAVAQETGNGDVEIASTTVPIVIDYNSTVFDRTFTATDRSIWGNDQAIGFSDADFFGPNMVFGDAPEFTLPVPIPGTPLFVNATADIDGHFRFGFDYDVEINGGSVDATAPVEVTLETTYNHTTDMLQFDALSSVLPGLNFTTDGPGGHFYLNALADVDLTFSLLIDLPVGPDFQLVPSNFNHAQAFESLQIVNISDQSSLSFDLPAGFSVTAAFPANIDATGSAGTPANIATGSDGSNEFIQIGWNLGVAASQFVPIIAPLFNPVPLVVPPLVGTIIPITATVGVGANVIQNFALTLQGIDFDVLLEDNTLWDLDPVTGLQISNASQHDIDGDGLEFTLVMNPIARLHNDTEIGINFDWNLDLLRADLDVPLPVDELIDVLNDIIDFIFGDDFSLPSSIGIHAALVDLGQNNIPVTEIDVLERDFQLQFQTQSASFIV